MMFVPKQNSSMSFQNQEHLLQKEKKRGKEVQQKESHLNEVTAHLNKTTNNNQNHLSPLNCIRGDYLNSLQD